MKVMTFLLTNILAFASLSLSASLIHKDNHSSALPASTMELEKKNVALVVTDPQVDFLSPNGAAWGVVSESVMKNKTIEHIEGLFKKAKELNIPVFVSPHYYYKTDKTWKFEGALEKLMHKINMFDRPSALSLAGFEGSGADFLPLYKPYILDDQTIITSPHKIYGPDTNDLVLQLRKQKIDQVILAGMSANLCVESHLRELLEQGFEVAVVSDATAGAIIPEGDGYKSAMTNFKYISNAVWTTEDTLKKLDYLK